MTVIICNQIYCTEWSLQISIAPSTIQHFPNANETKFQIAINSKSFVVGSNRTLLFTGQGQTSAGPKVRGRPHRRVDETVEIGRVRGEGRAEKGEQGEARQMQRDKILCIRYMLRYIHIYVILYSYIQ